MIDKKHPSLLIHKGIPPVPKRGEGAIREAEQQFVKLVEKRLRRLALEAAENAELRRFAEQLAVSRIIREQQDVFTAIVDRLDVLTKNAELEGEVLVLLKERLTSTK